MGIVDKFTGKNKEEDSQEEKEQKTKGGSDSNNGKVASKSKRILISPIVSEKAAVKEQEGKYTFEVNPKANKIEIKRAVKEAFGVKPEKVRTMNMKGKRKRFGLQQGKRKDWKKAIVTLPEGESINVHAGV